MSLNDALGFYGMVELVQSNSKKYSNCPYYKKSEIIKIIEESNNLPSVEKARHLSKIYLRHMRTKKLENRIQTMMIKALKKMDLSQRKFWK